VPSERGGIVFGTGIGGIETLLVQHSVLLEKGPGRVSPFMVPALMANAAAGHLAMKYGFTGPNYCTVSACASSNHAIGEGMRLIRDGYLDLCIAGGSEAATLPLTVAAFAQMTALTKNPDPESASRPFDKDRNGFVLSEGAAALILESEEHAEARGARIYCEVAGYGMSDDAHHITAPDPKGSGAALAMRWALADAGEEPASVSYVNAHGTSTPLNDASETVAIKAVLGDEIAHRVAISSTKSMTGHMLGAAGAVEGAVCALAIQRGVVPPTIHYETPDPDCDLDYVPNHAREMDVSLALSNSFGFGGQNACVAFRRVA
jgi:3-oxoacyl-[acyl-carrier-protein] synthase II